MAVSFSTSRRRSRGGIPSPQLHRPMSEINVTPMVDVMLVLLIIFMVAAPLLTVGVPVELAEDERGDHQRSGRTLGHLHRQGQRAYLQDTEIGLDDLGAAAQRDHQ